METAITAPAPESAVVQRQPLEELYVETFPVVAGWVHRMGGTYADAKDIFHDALVIYQEKAVAPGFALQSAEAAYLLGIAKHLWLRQHRQLRSRVQLSALELELKLPDDYFPDVNSLRLLQLLERSGRKCLDLLRAFYYQQLSPARVAERFGYGSTHSVSVQKYKCLEKVRNTVKEKALSYEDLLN